MDKASSTESVDCLIVCKLKYLVVLAGGTEVSDEGSGISCVAYLNTTDAEEMRLAEATAPELDAMSRTAASDVTQDGAEPDRNIHKDQTCARYVSVDVDGILE